MGEVSGHDLDEHHASASLTRWHSCQDLTGKDPLPSSLMRLLAEFNSSWVCWMEASFFKSLARGLPRFFCHSGLSIQHLSLELAANQSERVKEQEREVAKWKSQSFVTLEKSAMSSPLLYSNR